MEHNVNPAKPEATTPPGAWLGYLAACGMGVCAGLTASETAGAFVLGGLALLLPAVCVIVAIESTYTRLTLGRLNPTSREWLRYRLGEWFIIVAALKLITLAIEPDRNVSNELQVWFRNPLLFFWDPHYFLALIAVILTWLTVSVVIGDLLELRVIDPQTLAFEQETGLRRNFSGRRDNMALHIAIFGVGMGVVLGAGALFGRGEKLSGVWLFAYFALALLVLALTQYNTNVTLWQRDGAAIDPRLRAAWSAYALAALALLGVVALLLPTGFASTLLAGLGRILGVAAFIGLYAVFLLLQLVSYIFYAILLLMSLLFGTPPPPVPTVRPPSPEPLVGQATAGAPWLEVLQSMLFWLAVAALIAYSSFFFLRRRGVLRRPSFAVRSLARSMWGSLTALLRLIRQRGLRPVAKLFQFQARSPGARPKPGPAEGFSASLRAALGRMSPRERVLLYYRAMLDRNAKAGLPRAPSQTPEEYAKVMNELAPNIENEVESLTQAFDEARYSAHDVGREQESLVRRNIAAVRAFLRAPRKK